jgi:hypothetical protein
MRHVRSLLLLSLVILQATAASTAQAGRRGREFAVPRARTPLNKGL